MAITIGIFEIANGKSAFPNGYDNFDDVAKTTVTVGSNTYTVWSISARSGVVYEGVEQGTKRRYLFRTDWALTITEN